MLGLNTEELIIIGVTFVGFTGVFIALRSMLSKRDLKKRMTNLRQGEAGNNAAPDQEKAKIFAEKQKITNSAVGNYIQNSAGGSTDRYRILFERAGWSPANAVVFSILGRIALGIAGIFIFFGLTVLVPVLIKQSILLKLLLIVVGFFVGLRSFEYVLNTKIKMRYTKIKKDLSSALDLLVICTNAGLSIDKGFEQVAQEIGKYNTELAKEFALSSIELNIMPDRKSAFQNLSKRVDIPLIRGLATTLVQSEEQGTSVSQTLSVLAEEFRAKSLLEAETKAARLPALLALPVVVFTLPSLLMVILGPAIVQLINARMFL